MSFFIGIMMLIVIVICIESICHLLNTNNKAQKPRTRTNYVQGYSLPDGVLGYKPKGSIQAASSKRSQGKTIYDVTYSIDEYHRRITPIEDRSDRDTFAVFFGCSCTFGEGVDNNQTLPYYFSRLLSHYVPYNYGFHGYGPQQMLAKLQTGNLRKEIQEKAGILIYLYLPFHVERAIGSMNIFNRWGKIMPYYTIDAQNNLIRKGSFLSGRPLVSWSYRLLGKSNFIKYFDIRFPLQLTDRRYKLTARIIEESRKEFRRQFASDHFYVVLFPVGKRGKEEVEKIIPYFDKAGIKYLDYTMLFRSMPRDEYRIVGDGHPSPKAHKTVAERLSQDLSSLD